MSRLEKAAKAVVVAIAVLGSSACVDEQGQAQQAIVNGLSRITGEKPTQVYVNTPPKCERTSLGAMCKDGADPNDLQNYIPGKKPVDSGN